MAPAEERRGSSDSSKEGFDGRDLLVGRPEGAEGRQSAGAAGTPPAATAPQPGAHDDAIREILETVRATAARIDALEETPGPEHETAEALARETAALTQAVEDARGALDKAAELAARRDGREAADARALAEAAAALKAQGEALDKRLRVTGKQAQANARQAEVAAQGMAELTQAATALESTLRGHTETMSRMTGRLRWRPWLTGLAIGAASFVFFVLGAVLQGEADVMSLGDPHREWNDHVVEHFAPLLAACASKARLEDKPIGCPVTIYPTREVAIPFPPNVNLTELPPEDDSDPTVEP